MKPGEFLKEDADDVNPYERVGRIKRQVIPTSHKASKLQELCLSKGIKRGANVFVKVEGDYQHCAFIRAGEKMIHVHNYVTNQNEAADPKTIYTQEGYKYIPIITTKTKKVSESEDSDSQFPALMGGYVPPFNVTNGTVLDRYDTIVAECKNKHFARIITIALNMYVTGRK